MKLRQVLISSVIGLGLLASERALAAEARTVAPEVVRFEQFIREAAPLCLRRPAIDCIDAGWAYADRDGDDRVSLDELLRVRGTLLDWTEWRDDSLHTGERAAIVFGVWLVDNVGLENLMASYNASGDGRLSREELLTDVRLDSRPLGEVLLDPEAVDRAAVARRLGPYSPMLEGLLQPAD